MIKVEAWISFAFRNYEANWNSCISIHNYQSILCVYILEFLRSAYVFMCVFI